MKSYYHMIIKRGCPFCDMAQELAEQEGLLCYVEDATDTPEWLTETKKRYQHNTVPIITKVTVADGDVEVSLVGGFTEFKESLDFEKR